jgi:hypothetical protein
MGKVRNVFPWRAKQGAISARVVSHHSPTNKGDSGGPVLNNKGEVVAFISQGTIGEPQPPGSDFHMVQVTDLSIAVEEIVLGLEANRKNVAAK